MSPGQKHFFILKPEQNVLVQTPRLDLESLKVSEKINGKIQMSPDS